MTGYIRIAIFADMYYLDDITDILVPRGYSAENPVTLSNGDRSMTFKKGDFSATVWEYVNRVGNLTISMFVCYRVNGVQYDIAATNGNTRYEYTNIPSDTMVGLLSGGTTDTLEKFKLHCANAVTEILLNTL